MKKLTPEEAAALPKKPRGNLSPVYLMIIDLQKGDNLHVTQEDWGRKYPISNLIRRISKKKSRQFSLTHLADNKGWIITCIN